MGKMIPDAPCKKTQIFRTQRNNLTLFLYINVIQTEGERVKQQLILTEINLAPIQMREGEGKGSNKRPTPNTATAKKWRTKLKGRGFNPESRETGPVENTPPRLK
jgi:hypothetical protein